MESLMFFLRRCWTLLTHRSSANRMGRLGLPAPAPEPPKTSDCSEPGCTIPGCRTWHGMDP